jgi:hypothetical protein
MIEAFKMTEEQFKLDLEKRITAINMILMQEFPSLVHLLAFLRYVIDNKYVLPNRGTVPVPTAATDGFNTWSEIVLNLHFCFNLPTAIDYTHKMDNTSNIRIKFIGCFIKKKEEERSNTIPPFGHLIYVSKSSLRQADIYKNNYREDYEKEL